MKWVYKQDAQKVDELRPVLDALTHVDVIWRPFEDHRHHISFDDICLYMSVLKWYGTIVIYLPNKCICQFGYRQYISPPLSNSDTLDVDFEWIVYHVSVMEVICPVVLLPSRMMWMLITWIGTIGCHVLVMGVHWFGKI